MLSFIYHNLGTIIVSALVAAAVVLALLKLYRDRKKGVGSCGKNCGGCPFSGECGKKTEENKKFDNHN